MSVKSNRINEDSVCCFRSISSKGIRVCWEILAKCNLSCHHCMVYSPIRKGPSLSRMLQIVEEMTRINVHKVLISGGEPFLFPFLEELCFALYEKGILVDINTNATQFTIEKLEGLKKMGVTELTISLDGSSKEIYEKCRPNANWFQVIENISNAVKLGFDVDIVFVPTKLNQHQLEETANLSCNLNCKSLTVAGLVRFEKAHQNWHSLALDKMELQNLYSRIKKLRSEISIPLRSNRIATSLPPTPCGAGESVLGIDAAGYVHPCPLYILQPSLQNDVIYRPLEEIVYSSEFQSLLPQVNSMNNCSSCPHNSTCKGGCFGVKQMLGLSFKNPDPICEISF
ncbi:Radical SAM domain protein [Limnospira maxima CS-328]|uniref:Radical SAM domain protein n=1 Tax=Limnospira maxima CS-328 TaxID=513049 RepID=B5VZA8_LIMMA|nr:radical SAM protein [Limnospira maxima]EDZ95309.1 Radical SAM domain protein [Limnospira maxima CS-328]MDC0839019.1 radical SAM protein [Limnoraphis robusta]